jgi:tripartite-type tricarboxylate transporter receptor subunit TctC
MKSLFTGVGLLVNLALLSNVCAATPEEFFKGKSVRLIVGTSVGGANDDWARFIAQYLGKHIPGNPAVVVQNMPGAGTVIAANHIFNIAKPDGLTLGLVNPGIYTDQLLGASEVKFDWPKFSFIVSPERYDQVLFMRADGPYKTIEDIRKASEPPRCAAQARTTLSYFFPKLVEEGLGLKVNIVAGYGGGGEMNLAIEKGEVHCRSGTVSAYVGREPTRTWIKSGFVRALVQSGATRFAKLPETPTIYELLNSYKASETSKRLTKVMLAAADLGRPFIAPPGMPAERVNLLRSSFVKALEDPDLLADAKKRGWDIDLTSGEELEKLAKEVIVQPPEVIERVRKMLGN